MLAVISPAKRLDFEDMSYKGKSTMPVRQADTAELVKAARKLSKSKIKNLMGLSDDLAVLNYERFQSFSDKPKKSESKPAIFAFRGDVYLGLQADSFDDQDLAFAQDHLRILSGLYGVLRPLDRIQPYRLEMGSKLKNPRGENLYDFWGSDIGETLTNDLKSSAHPVLINLASNEYFKAAKKGLNVDIITPEFKEIKDGKARMLGAFAKQARGMMVRYMTQNRIDDPEGLKDFNLGGYKYQKDLSTPAKWVFTRKQPPPTR
ncbi:MAG: peroxide stress protein YaaA [Alphaproteobacteria bacterium]|nr:MAG: peroxide stress protein YaaA [Alphaproteobacteria bacterium]